MPTQASDAAIESAYTLIDAGKAEHAEAALRRLLLRCPGDHRVAFMLGQVMMTRGQPDQAVFFLARAVELAPDAIEPRLELAFTLRRLRKFQDAFAAARAARDRAPARADVHVEFAQICREMGRFEDAHAALDAAAAIAPGDLFMTGARGSLYFDTGRAEQALAPLRASLNAPDVIPNAWCNYAYTACAASSLSPDQLAAVHAEVAAFLHHPDPQPPAPVLDPDPDRPLRVAILSPDLCRHSVAYFFEPLAEHLDKSAFSLIALYAANSGDEVTARLKRHFARWYTLPGGKESEIVRLLQDERIDIAIDLAGYTEGTLIYTLRRRAAPIQVMYLGYPHSSGLSTMDYRLVDGYTDPPGDADRWASERLVRLPGCFLCYRPPQSAPPVAPRDPDAPVRFGSFNRLVKASAATRRLWGRVLAAVPGSVLVLKDRAFAHEQGRRGFESLMAAEGVTPDRLELIARLPSTQDHLKLYHRIDVALDTTPYTGTTTTCEALWMGVPTVTLAGLTHVSRVSGSLLHAAGLPELVASTEDEYVAIAAALAHDAERRAALRTQLRPMMERSPLRDEAGFTRRFEATLRALWRARVRA